MHRVVFSPTTIDMKNETKTETNISLARAERFGIMPTSTSTSLSYGEHHARMLAAFKVLEPLGGDWRDPINRTASVETFNLACRSLGVSMADALESVRYFTACEPVVTLTVDGRVTVTAPGYRNGPAGP